jgi:DNA-binding transcriptional regulator LsrR (DeoR family)
MPRQQILDPRKIEVIAVLVAEHMMPQAEIADLMDLSPTLVNRAVKGAMRDGLIVRRLEVTEKVSEESRLAANNLRKITPLKEALRALEQGNGEPCLQELYVFDSGETSQDVDEPVRRFSRPMATYLSRQLVRTDVKHIGISWGVALLSLVDVLRVTLSNHPRKGDPVICIPIAGSPPEVEEYNKTSSAHLAGALSRILNGSAKAAFSFSVGGWIPAGFSARECSVIRNFCFASPSYEKAFCDGGTIHKLDCVLTSVGATKDFERPWLKAAAQASTVSLSEFRDLSVGNIAGCFLPVPGLDARGRKVLDSVNERWLGIQISHLQHCAAAALRKRTPGVVVVAIGEGKAPVVLEAIKHKLVNIVCCDMRLMKRLEELCAQEPQSLEA